MQKSSRILNGVLALLLFGMLTTGLILALKSFQNMSVPSFQSPILTPTPLILSTTQPAPTLTPVGGIFDSPLPGPTKTPMPELTEVKLAEIRLLTFDENYPQGKELKDLMDIPPDWPYETNGSFNVLGWATPSDLVVQPVIPHTQESERPI